MKGISKYWNKISLKTILPFFAATSFLYSCQEPDPFPNTPQIQFNNMQYVELLENGNPDSLILFFDFQDGDGDLGIEGNEISPPFHDFDLIVDANSKVVTLGQPTVDLPLFTKNPFTLETRFFSDTDNRPGFGCSNYDTLQIDEEKILPIQPGNPFDPEVYSKDTLYIERNLYKNNIIVEFYRKRGLNEYEEIDWKFLTSEFGCGISFDGRFPILDIESAATSGSLEGTIKYAMVSTGFRTVLRKDTFNIRFQIIDRSLNISDWAETGDITLDQLIL